MNKFSKTVFTMSVLSAMINTAVYAQQAQSEPAVQSQDKAEKDIEVIVVSASKRLERLQDVPSTVNVVSGDTIEKLNLKSFNDIEQLSPGLSLTSKEPNVNSVVLRGIGFNPNSSSSPTVDIYFNETPLDTVSAFKAMYDIGQVEVLRGPQGTLRGKTSPSGAITIASRKASLQDNEGYFQQTLTNKNGVNSQGAFGTALIDDKLAVRVAGLYDKSDGAGAYNLQTGQKDEDKTESFRTSFALAPADDFFLDLTYQYMDSHALSTPILFSLEGSTTDPVLSPGDRKGKSTKPGVFDYKGHVVSLTGVYFFENANLDYVGGYQDIEQGRTTDLAYGGSIPDYSKDQSFVSAQKRVTQEFRLTSQGDRFWHYLFGAYYEDGTGQTDLTQKQPLAFGFVSGQNPPLDYAVLDIAVDIPSDVQNYALFSDHRFQLTDDDLFQVGIRYQKTDVKRDFIQTLSGVILGPDPITQSAISPENRDVSYNQVTGGFSYRHDFNNDLTGYFNYGRSYRPGGVVSTTAVLDEDVLVFDAETSNNYELGLKGSLFDKKNSFTLAVFQQDFKNYLAYTESYISVSTTKDGVVDNNVAFTFNADAQVRGIEASFNSRVWDSFHYTLGATYTDAAFKNATIPCNDFDGDGTPDNNGNPSVPVGENVAFCHSDGRTSAQARWSFSAQGEYVVPVRDGDLFARALLNYSPERKDPFSSSKYDALLNDSVFFGYRTADNKYEVSIFAKNLRDDDTITTGGFRQIDYDLFDSGYAVATLVKPREVGVVFTARY